MHTVTHSRIHALTRSHIHLQGGRGEVQRYRNHLSPTSVVLLCAPSLHPPPLPLQVPIPLYLLTHAYFCFYHVVANVTIRRIRHAVRPAFGRTASFVVEAAWIILLAYVTAFMETLTIANVRAGMTRCV